MQKVATTGFILNVFIEMPLLISKTENVDMFVVSLGALLHDIADAKFHKGDETDWAKKSKKFSYF